MLKEVERVKLSVMAEQVSKPVDPKNALRNKTNIERIRDMQRTFRFAVATNGNDVDEKD